MTGKSRSEGKVRFNDDTLVVFLFVLFCLSNKGPSSLTERIQGRSDLGRLYYGSGLDKFWKKGKWKSTLASYWWSSRVNIKSVREGDRD